MPPAAVLTRSARGGVDAQLATVSTADDEIFDFGELLVDRAERGSRLCAKVTQLDRDCREVCLDRGKVCVDCPKADRMLALVCTQCVHRGQNSTVVSLGSFKRRYARFQVFQRRHHTIVWAVPTSGERQSTTPSWLAAFLLLTDRLEITA